MRTLARRGISSFLWNSLMMPRAAVVDGAWSMIGSYNCGAGRFNGLEGGSRDPRPRVGAELVAEFDGDLPLCVPFDTAAWTKLPWWRKAFAWLAFRLRRFL